MAVKEKKKKPQVEYEKQPESPTKKFDVTYAIVSVIAIIVLFSVLVTAYYKNNYIMFSPEKGNNSTGCIHRLPFCYKADVSKCGVYPLSYRSARRIWGRYRIHNGSQARSGKG